jgi:hypothetical protein
MTDDDDRRRGAVTGRWLDQEEGARWRGRGERVTERATSERERNARGTRH